MLAIVMLSRCNEMVFSVSGGGSGGWCWRTVCFLLFLCAFCGFSGAFLFLEVF